MILSKAIFSGGLNVLQTQSHGAEVRGGIVNADVIFCDVKGEKIYDFNVESFDYLLILSKSGLQNFLPSVKEDTVLILTNTTGVLAMIEGVLAKTKYLLREEVVLPQIEFEVSLSMSYLGAFTQVSPDLDLTTLEETIKKEIKGKFLEDSLTAAELGHSSLRLI